MIDRKEVKRELDRIYNLTNAARLVAVHMNVDDSSDAIAETLFIALNKISFLSELMEGIEGEKDEQGF